MNQEPQSPVPPNSARPPRNKQAGELEYITKNLVQEFVEKMTGWNREYAQVDRDLGIRASFAEVWRKAKKVKAIVWEGEDDAGWREGLRTILFEIIGHAMLMLFDIDHGRANLPKSSRPPVPIDYCGGDLLGVHSPHPWGDRPEDVAWCEGFNADSQ